MKLIQILALTAAMATMATAQNTGKTPTPTPTPAKSPSPSASKQGAAQPAKPTAGTTQSGTAKGSPAKPAASPAAAKSGPVISAAPAGKPTPAATKPGAPKAGNVPVLVAKPSPTPATNGGKKASVAPSVTAKKKSTKGAATSGAKPKTGQPKLAEVAPSQTPEKKKPVQRLTGAAGRRDPFVSPIRVVTGTVTPTTNCTSGKRCLSIPELVLRGTVRDITGKMMAVVSNSAQRTYTLRENDQVFNGSVEKITSDSIIFREFVKDALGRETAREVVKKLAPTT